MITASAYETVNQQGNMDLSKATPLGFDESGLGAIMDTLTNMYSNPALAVVREYASNARDSHVAAGNDAPIEVRLPTTLNPQLTVQDYGLGLTEEEILNTFARYGSSTKRKSNDFIGAMGIGSKSAYTVGSQFTVTGVKDGQKTIVLFYKDEHNTPTKNVVDRTTTTEPNGVLIDIGVEDVNAVRKAARELFATWPKYSVKVDDELAETIWDNTDDIGSNTSGQSFHLHQTEVGYEDKHFNFVMGGVSYKVNDTLIRTLSIEAKDFIGKVSAADIKFYVQTPIGSVDITPSREELRITPHTTAAVNQGIRSIAAQFAGWISSQINDAPTFTEAAKKLYRINNAMSLKAFTKDVMWHGRPFNTPRMQFDYPNYRLAKRSYHDHKGITKAERVLHVTIDMDLDNLIMVTGVPDGKENTVRRYVKAYLLDMGEKISNSKIVVVATPLTHEENEWFSYGKDTSIESIPFEEWRDKGKKLLNIATGGTRGKRNETLYEVDGEDEKMTAADIIELGVPIAVADVSEDGWNNRVAIDALKPYTLVTLTRGQQIATFQKRVPEAKLMRDIIHTFARKVVMKITRDDRDMLAANVYLASINQQQMSFLSEMHAAGLLTHTGAIAQAEEYEAAAKLSRAAQTRLGYLQTAARISGEHLNTGAVSREDYFKENFPLLHIATSNTYYAKQLGYNGEKMLRIGADYINQSSI